MISPFLFFLGITSFFDEIDHEWMLMFLGHRIADQRLLGLICKWLKAGVMEDGRRVAATKGTPQGAVISPLLANIYLHYVLDLWARQWRERHARGDVIVVRYADDSVVGFRLKSQAQKLLEQLRERLARFGLSPNASKTRLVEFGRFAARNRRDRGLGKPETFDFLGFTHCCSSNRNGGFQILRLTCGFHAIRPPSPLSSGQAFQGHLATCSTAIRPGSRSAATQGWHC
ncbi:reverse transcriptase domain-containing protein [Halomonas cupida]|uniref:reverse transcriptase domain-containing protein n=1 Tax=Halomonas cupida TaxID=44933 RepID=UPI001F5B92C1|nr:reverse transcriptase domain-containing protein [Pseudomonas oleovorans]